VDFASHVSAPAGIRAGPEPRKLAELRIPPFHIEIDWHLAKFRSPPRGCIQLHDSRVCEVQAHVGARGLAAQPYPPDTGIFLPEREVGIDQRKRQLLNAVEVDSGVGRGNVRKRRRVIAAAVERRTCLCCRGAEERIQIPVPLR
jgi:hypothetical protein